MRMSAPRPIIVIPGDDPPQIQGSPHLDRLRTIGDVRLFTDRPATEAEQVRRAQGATCLINSRSAVKWPGRVLRKLPDLRMVAVCGIGTDAVDLATAREQGVVVCNLPGQTASIVAEHAVGLLFAAAKRAWFQTDELKQGRWIRGDNVYLHGKTLGLVGAGAIAARVAQLATALGMRVVAWTPHASAERAARLGLEFLPLDDVLRRCHALSVHVPLTEQTRGLIGRRELALLQRGALLVNTARGPIVDAAALVDALESGHLAGAGIDVFDTEPPPADHPLLRCRNVVLTAHNADQTPEGVELLNAGVVDNVIAFLSGQPRHQVA
jgi:phosphoglycerate dehydrogenase-like enzyme